jgi:hypothetical protein
LYARASFLPRSETVQGLRDSHGVMIASLFMENTTSLFLRAHGIPEDSTFLLKVPFDSSSVAHEHEVRFRVVCLRVASLVVRCVFRVRLYLLAL